MQKSKFFGPDLGLKVRLRGILTKYLLCQLSSDFEIDFLLSSVTRFTNSFHLNMADAQDPYAQRIYAPNVAHNQALYNVRFISACFAGSVAGILGLENWQGFLLFGLSTLLSALVMYINNCKMKPSKYLFGGLWELINPGQENMFSFVLVWTLIYGE